MIKQKSLFLLLLVVTFFGISCKKSEPYNAKAQLQKDEQLIEAYLEANNITATRHQSGVYYIISNPGSGTVDYTMSTRVNFKYTLRLLGGQVIPQTTDPITFALSELIVGWQIGIPLIQPGGKIRLFVPSVYAYGPGDGRGIPANSVLDFDIELLNVSY